MKRTKLLTICLIAGFTCILAKAQKPSLTFSENGAFRIAQIADPHYSAGKEQRLKIIAEMLETEKPDLVVYTGDFVNSNEVKDLDALFDLCIQRKIPWAFTLGNHDDEHAFTREKLAQYLVEKPYCIGEIGPDIGGYGNYIVEIRKQNEEKPSFLLYCMDNAYQPAGFEAKGWVTYEQIGWYRARSAEYTVQNGNKPLPAIAFFHIPLDEYTWVSSHPKESKMLGDKGEQECLGVLNSGLFQAFWECKDVFAVFCGHDHLNDYLGIYHGIALAYGRSSCQIEVIGSRIIELYSNGKPRLKTWLRLANGRKINETSLP